MDALVIQDHLGATRQELEEGQMNLEGVQDPAPPGFSVKDTYKVGLRLDQVFKPYPKIAQPSRKNRGSSMDQSRDASRGRRVRGSKLDRRKSDETGKS